MPQSKLEEITKLEKKIKREAKKAGENITQAVVTQRALELYSKKQSKKKKQEKDEIESIQRDKESRGKVIKYTNKLVDSEGFTYTQIVETDCPEEFKNIIGE